jgi:hypothetical protein
MIMPGAPLRASSTSIPNGALKLCMVKQRLHCSQVLRSAIEQRRFSCAHPRRPFWVEKTVVCERQLLADSVEKAGFGFQGRKVRVVD